MKKIDVHVHVGKGVPLMDEGISCTGISTDSDNLLKHMDKHHVEKAIILAMDIPGSLVSNDFVAELQAKNPDRFVGCACINPLNHPDFGILEMIRCIDKLGLKALKLMPPYQFFHVNDKRLYPLYTLLEQRNILLIVHTGTTDWQPAKLEFCRPLELDTVAVDFPKLKILMAHSGDPWFEETKDILHKNKNVYADFSGIVLESDPNRGVDNLKTFFDNYLHQFPINKLLFGTDWPFTSFESYEKALSSYKISEKALKIINLSEEEIWEKLLYSNAAKMLNLK
ncbi:MAG: amidohydrolase family protein [Candidatus Nanoarchaeia archaeon]